MAEEERPRRARHARVAVDGNELTAILRRLEAATSRLEDIASSSNVDFNVTPTNGTGAPQSASATAATNGSPPPKPAESLPPSIEAFDALLNTELKAWMDLSSKLGSVIDGQVCAKHQLGRKVV